MTRTDVPDAGDERSVRLRMLDYGRETAIAEVEGLADVDAQRSPLPTSPLMSPAGVLSHLRGVEHSWVETRFAGRPSLGPWAAVDPDADLRLGLTTPLDDLVVGYRGQIAVDDAIITGADLDGDLDLLREMVNGTVGD